MRLSISNNMVTPLVKQLESEIAKLLLDKLSDSKITPERAAEVARFAISTLPDALTDDQARKIIPSLDDTFFELAGVVHKHLSKDEDEQRNKVTLQAQDFIKQGHMEEATKLMRDYFSGKIT